jgi:lysophospholipase L1-like esterase
MTCTTVFLLRRRAARFAAVSIALALGGLTMAAPGQAKPNSRARSGQARRSHVQSRSGGWLTTWAASPMQASPGTSGSAAGFNDQTLREIVYPSTGGSQVRVRLSNVFGTQPLVVGAASIGVQLAGANVVPGTLRGLTFGGKATVTIPAGKEVLSDPARYHVAAEENLAISLYLPDGTGPATNHSDAQQDNWVSTTGDFTQSPTSTAYTTDIASWYFLDGVVVPRTSKVLGTVVAFGDSITDGAFSDQDANQRWSDILGDRLQRQPGSTLSVVDEGIGGDRLLSDSPCFGQSGLNRFERDVIGQPGVRDVIVLLGTNDLGFHTFDPSSFGPALAPCFPNPIFPTVQQMIDGYKQLITAAHAAGIKIIGATITPNGEYGGVATNGVKQPATEQERLAINHWILTSGAFDGTVDFSSAIADPLDPTYIDPKYITDPSGVHPNDAGYRKMAHAVNLSTLRR